jgi:RecA/RadA recombinase
MAQSRGEKYMKPFDIFVFGGIGSGKTTFCSKLCVAMQAEPSDLRVGLYVEKPFDNPYFKRFLANELSQHDVVDSDSQNTYKMQKWFLQQSVDFVTYEETNFVS